MSLVPKYCLVCLDPNTLHLRSVKCRDEEGITLRQKLDYCVFELTKSKLDFVGYLCHKCEHAIDLFYKIKSLCLTNDQKVKNIIDAVRDRFTSFEHINESVISEAEMCQVSPRNSYKKSVFSCSRCPRMFRTERHLNKHMKIHKNMTLFHCIHCLKRFSCKFHLKEHLQTHKQNPVIVDAIKKFKKVRSTMYQCNICSVTIFRKINLKRHFKRCHLEGKIYFNASFSIIDTPQKFRSLPEDNKYDGDVSYSESETESHFDLDETLTSDELQMLMFDESEDEVIVNEDIDMYNSYFTDDQRLLDQHCQIVPN